MNFHFIFGTKQLLEEYREAITKAGLEIYFDERFPPASSEEGAKRTGYYCWYNESEEDRENLYPFCIIVEGNIQNASQGRAFVAVTNRGKMLASHSLLFG